MRNLPRAILPNRIREHRKRGGMTLEVLAGRLHCSITQVSDLELGKRQLTQRWMNRLARVLAIKQAELLPVDDAVALTEEENELMVRYRTGTGIEQEMLLAISRIIIRVPL